MTNMHYLLTAAGAAAGEGSIMESVMSFAPILVVIVVFYFMLIRPQQKKDKEDRAMRENLEIGDEIVTMGGIIGLVVSVETDARGCVSRFDGGVKLAERNDVGVDILFFDDSVKWYLTKAEKCCIVRFNILNFSNATTGKKSFHEVSESCRVV